MTKIVEGANMNCDKNTKQWIEDIANIGKNVKVEVYKIIIKQTTINCKTAITKYRALLNINLKLYTKNISPNNR